MAKLIWFTTIFVLFLAIFFPGILGLSIRRIPSDFQPPLTDSQSIDKNISIKQTFNVRNDNLSAIGLSIKNPYYRNKQDLYLDLYDDQGILIRSVKLNGRNIADGNYLIINFGKVSDSAGRNFYFTLRAPEVESSDSLAIYHSAVTETGRQYFVNGQPKEGSLAFVYYWNPDNPAANPLMIYRNLLTKLFQDLLFAIIYLFIILVLSMYILRSFFRRIN